MHYVKAKGILSPKNGMNLYRGCTHGCIYCDARSTCYHMTHAFEDIEIKENAEALLEEALRKKRKKCMIGMGSMTDPYIPLEKEVQSVRRALELIEKYGFGVTLITKSDLVLRDIDILQKINEKTKCVVQMTLTTFDEALCRKIEPGVATTKRRVEVLHVLRDAGIPTVVWLCPILPFINDTRENLEGILEYCRAAGVWGILSFGMGLTLREGSREYFYKNLDALFPGMKERYIKTYGNAYELASPNHGALMQAFKNFCRKENIECDIHKIFTYLHTFETKEKELQYSFFDTI